jgi:hypothetical protein
MTTRNGRVMMKTTITIAVVAGITLLFMGLLIPKEIQAQNSTASSNTTNTMNNPNNMTMNSNPSASAGSKIVNSTDLGTFSVAGPIAGVILPSSSAVAGAQGAGSNMTSMPSSSSTSTSNTTSSSASSATITNSTTISSVLPAKAFILSGAWHLKAENGKITFLDVRFTKVHLDASNRHVHEIGNFHPASNNTSILLNPDGITTIAGTVDIKFNDATTWTNVKTVILIDKLSTIAITLDPKDTSNHFLGQSVYGTVSMLKDKDRNDIVTFARP